MIRILIAFLLSFIITYLIIRSKHLHESVSGDLDVDGPQKFHTISVPRIGSIGIAIGLVLSAAFQASNFPFFPEMILLVCSLPVFAIGLAEDLTKKISVRIRLICAIISATFLTYLAPLEITSIGIPIVDDILSLKMFSSALAIFAITGLVNAYNIIDGFNGLASMTGVFTLIAIGCVGAMLDDPMLEYLSIAMAASILGFFLWNYPRGLIFLGDGGAYLIGFWIAGLSILIVCRHQEVSPWFSLLINGYPITETMFTIYRRKIHQNKNPGLPDGTHLHTLMYRRTLPSLLKSKKMISAKTRNAMVAPSIAIFLIPILAISIIFYKSSLILSTTFIIFLITYIKLYSSIVHFKIRDIFIK